MTTPTSHCLKRLQIELHKLNMEKGLSFQVGADPQNMLRCYFVMHGPVDTPYEGGRYVGFLEIPFDYPFKPPSVQMCTPSGRLATGMKICLSNSSYHPESWSPMWGLRTILIALVSFFASEEPTTGSVNASAEERRKYAADSRLYNVNRLQAVYKRVLPDAFAADMKFIENVGVTPGDEGRSSSDRDEEIADHEDAPADWKPETATQECVAPGERAAVSKEKPSGRGSTEAPNNKTAAVAAAPESPCLHRQSHHKSASGAIAQQGGHLHWRRYASLIVLLALGLGLLRQLM
ncbi:hypothetical protein JKF63_01685 [Porcisia hertigi]|uniref:UBC core domain-containing protein n=1 Tax=Porcisia hertigi TaxID=2761500 RepID=A0A836LB23_9TRYP|nr:hypothetical protein JKF63_01685 [Porcisia hertigi]